MYSLTRAEPELGKGFMLSALVKEFLLELSKITKFDHQGSLKKFVSNFFVIHMQNNA